MNKVLDDKLLSALYLSTYDLVDGLRHLESFIRGPLEPLKISKEFLPHGFMDLDQGDRKKWITTKDEHFMMLACLAAMQSSNPSTKVGGVIANARGEVVAIGYNKLITGMDAGILREQRGHYGVHDTKYPYMIH